MRVVFWGGPMHDQTLDVPDGLDPVLILPTYADRAPIGDPLLRASAMHPIPYRALRLTDGPTPTIARRKGSPPTWDVYVPESADDDTIARWWAAASRPVVDGPRSALGVLVDRYDRNLPRILAGRHIAASIAASRARVRRRGPLP